MRVRLRGFVVGVRKVAVSARFLLFFGPLAWIVGCWVVFGSPEVLAGGVLVALVLWAFMFFLVDMVYDCLEGVG